MPERSRRRFLSELGASMAVISLGPAVASDLGWHPGPLDPVDSPRDREMDALVDLITDTSPDRLQPLLVERLRKGTVDLTQIVAATALANACKFGGEDYTGYHAFMALLPSLEMSKQLSKDDAALPVLKVVWRNAARIQSRGGRRGRKLEKTYQPGVIDGPAGPMLRDLTRQRDVAGAETMFAGMHSAGHDAAWNDLQYTVRECTDVHRVVLAWRTKQYIPVVGVEHAATLLRQNVRFAIDRERGRLSKRRAADPVRKLVPELLDRHGLMKARGEKRKATNDWIASFAKLVYTGRKAEAAEATAKALASGIDPEDVGAAISIASNELILRQERDGQGNMKAHGATAGVHASDATNAWRCIARTCDARHAHASLIMAAHHACKQNRYRQAPYPHPDHMKVVTAKEPSKLLDIVSACIRDNDQGGTCAAIKSYLDLGHDVQKLRSLMIGYAVNDDGSLHHEKYWQTVGEEYATQRPAFRGRQLIAMGRVLASGAGERAPGLSAARKQLRG